MSNKLIFMNNTNCKLSQIFKKSSDYVCTDFNNINNIDFYKETYCGLVINCIDYSNNSDEFDDVINFCTCNKLPIIILNNHTFPIDSKELGFSLPSECIVVRNYDNYKVFDIWCDTYHDKPNQNSSCVYVSPGCNNFGCPCYNCCDNYYKKSKRIVPLKNYPNYTNMVSKVYDILQNDYTLPSNSILNVSEDLPSSKALSNINNLPKEQYNISYINFNFSENVDNNQPQVINNRTILEISLIASYRPPYKYLHLRTLGAGLNPGQLVCDSNCCRGWFQNTIDVYAHPDSDAFRIYSNEPKNVNNSTFYESSSDFSVGVNLSKYPSFRPIYRIIDKETTSVYDFSILNDTYKNFARWRWQLAITEKDNFNIFNSNFVRRTTIKQIPALAKYNLQPITDTVWYTSNEFNEAVYLNVRFTILYLYAYVQGNRLFGPRFRYTRYIDEIKKSYGTTIRLDFSSVSA